MGPLYQPDSWYNADEYNNTLLIFQALYPPPQGGHLHNRRLLGQGIHTAAAAAGERDASVAPEEAARAGGANRSTVANEIAEEKTEKQETWPGKICELNPLSD